MFVFLNQPYVMPYVTARFSGMGRFALARHYRPGRSGGPLLRLTLKKRFVCVSVTDPCSAITFELVHRSSLFMAAKIRSFFSLVDLRDEQFPRENMISFSLRDRPHFGLQRLCLPSTVGMTFYLPVCFSQKSITLTVFFDNVGSLYLAGNRKYSQLRHAGLIFITVQP